MRRLFASRGASAVATGVLMLLIAGGSYAIAAGSGAINACVQQRSHVVYTGKCRRGDQKLSWNIVGQRGPRGFVGAAGPAGPAGPTGSTGATGAAGAAGATGPSNGFSAYNPSFVTGLDNTTVVSLTLPAGKFILNGKVSVQDFAANESTACYLDPPGSTGTTGSIDLALASTTTSSIQETMSLAAPLTTSGGTVTIVCSSGDTTNNAARESHLTAIQVGDVTGS